MALHITGFLLVFNSYVPTANVVQMSKIYNELAILEEAVLSCFIIPDVSCRQILRNTTNVGTLVRIAGLLTELQPLTL